MIRFADEYKHPHCHFTYRRGSYVSPSCWPTRVDAERASITVTPDLRDIEIYAMHALNCACDPEEGGIHAS